MRDVYIIGMGFSPWLGFSEQVFTNFGTVAIDRALKDADIEWKTLPVNIRKAFLAKQVCR